MKALSLHGDHFFSTQDGFIEYWRKELEKLGTEQILRWAVETYGTAIALATPFDLAGCVLVSMLAEIRPDVAVVNIDPCRRRSLASLSKDFQAVILGYRRDQSELHADMPILSRDEQYGLLRIAPLARWSERGLIQWAMRKSIPFDGHCCPGIRYTESRTVCEIRPEHPQTCNNNTASREHSKSKAEFSNFRDSCPKKPPDTPWRLAVHEALLDNYPKAIFAFSIVDGPVYANERFLDLWSLDAESVKNMSYVEVGEAVAACLLHGERFQRGVRKLQPWSESVQAYPMTTLDGRQMLWFSRFLQVQGLPPNTVRIWLFEEDAKERFMDWERIDYIRETGCDVKPGYDRKVGWHAPGDGRKDDSMAFAVCEWHARTNG